MKRFALSLNRLYHAGLMIVLALCAVPALAQDGGTSTQGSVTTTTTTSTESWVSDWRVWALVGAVVLVILVIALTRGRGESNTTVVK
jgi:type II secretory pathway component PulF